MLRSRKDDPRLWGVDDVAAALDVTSEVVERWHRSGERVRGEPMPQPTLFLNLGRTPVWNEADVIAWAVRSGRAKALWPMPWRRSRKAEPAPPAKLADT